MAFSFNGTTQYISAASAPVTSAPLTMAFWGSVPDGLSYSAFCVYNSAAQSHHRVGLWGGAEVLSIDAGGYSYVIDGSASANVFHSSVGVVSANDNRNSYLDGSAGTANTVSRAPAGLNACVIGADNTNGSLLHYFNGKISEVAAWSAALTDAEIASLAKGYKPTRIRPQSLVFYAPLLRNLQDLRGGLDLTNNNGATVADHPRVY